MAHHIHHNLNRFLLLSKQSNQGLKEELSLGERRRRERGKELGGESSSERIKRASQGKLQMGERGREALVQEEEGLKSIVVGE